VVILFYRCSISEGEPKPLDCQDLRWVTREELAAFDFVEGDHPIIEMVLHDESLWLTT
jgi:A/G-specific adenine glycosylase